MKNESLKIIYVILMLLFYYSVNASVKLSSEDVITPNGEVINESFGSLRLNPVANNIEVN